MPCCSAASWPHCNCCPFMHNQPQRSAWDSWPGSASAQTKTSSYVAASPPTCLAVGASRLNTRCGALRARSTLATSVRSLGALQAWGDGSFKSRLSAAWAPCRCGADGAMRQHDELRAPGPKDDRCLGSMGRSCTAGQRTVPPAQLDPATGTRGQQQIESSHACELALQRRRCALPQNRVPLDEGLEVVGRHAHLLGG